MTKIISIHRLLYMGSQKFQNYAHYNTTESSWNFLKWRCQRLQKSQAIIWNMKRNSNIHVFHHHISETFDHNYHGNIMIYIFSIWHNDYLLTFHHHRKSSLKLWSAINNTGQIQKTLFGSCETIIMFNQWSQTTGQGNTLCICAAKLSETLAFLNLFA